MTPFIVSLLVKATLILASGLIVTASLRSFGPSFRHQVLLVTLGSCLVAARAHRACATMGCSACCPRRSGPAPPRPASSPVLSAGEVRRARSGCRTAMRSRQRRIFDARSDFQSGLGSPSRVALLSIVWAVGFLAVLIWLAAGRIRLHRIAERFLAAERRRLGARSS